MKPASLSQSRSQPLAYSLAFDQPLQLPCEVNDDYRADAPDSAYPRRAA
jgi:hypothetical protein